MDDLLQEFLTETAESLDVVDVELVRFEQNPNDGQILGNIFRLVHTIKGTCGFLGLPRLEALAHAAETLMGRYRDGEMVTAEGVSIILQSIDRLKVILDGLSADKGVEPAGSDDDLIDVLHTLSAASGESAMTAPEFERELKTGEVSLDELERAFQMAEGPAEFVNVSVTAAEAQVATDGLPPDTGAQPSSNQVDRPVSNRTIRVNLQTLEDLMTMVSELVLTRNQLLEIGRHHQDATFKAPLQRLSNVTAELQESVMQTRMQPIGNAWKKLPRIVRDLSKELGKDIDLVMVGEDTDLDRQVLELIQDPLTHMVRNSADHGLEQVAERLAAGKAATGTITLTAQHEGGHIVVEIADDGKGLPLDVIKRKALESGILTDAELGELSDQQVQKLIFHPGFSTASAVTNVSGRGVGMDVVRNNLEMIGGAIDLVSVEGQGTRFKINIPLTLSIVSALIVESGGYRYALPQSSVLELVRLGLGADHRVEQINGAAVLRLRDHLLPLIDLTTVLQSPQIGDPAHAFQQNGFVVVVSAGQQTFGLRVEAVFHTEEIVVKPLSARLNALPMYSGNTILGDGSVILILEPVGLASAVTSRDMEQVDSPRAAADLPVSASEAMTSMLLFRAGAREPKAVPLSLVTRIEEFSADQFEPVDDRVAVQYRDELMPIIFLDGASTDVARRRTALVFCDSGRSMALVVDDIVDIVRSNLTIDLASDQPGILGSAIIGGQATAILDVGHFLPLAFKDWFDRRELSSGSGLRSLLLVDDSLFFLNLLTPVLTASGYNVTTAGTGGEALSILNGSGHFAVVVSDIEMPEMTGHEFVKRMRQLDGYEDVPAIALSATYTPASIESALAAGFDDFVAKFDRAGLITALHEIWLPQGKVAA